MIHRHEDPFCIVIKFRRDPIMFLKLLTLFNMKFHHDQSIILPVLLLYRFLFWCFVMIRLFHSFFVDCLIFQHQLIHFTI